MAEYDPPTPEPAKEPDPEPVKDDPKPDLDALLATEREKTAESQKKLEDNQVAYEARMQQLEGMLQNKFAEKTPPPGAPPPTQQGVTAEDFLTPEGAAEATKKIAAQAANEMGQAIDANYRETMMNTRSAQFDIKLETLKGKKYFKYIEPKLNEAIRANPNLRYAPEALDILYNNIAGSMTDEILAGEAANDPVVPPTDPRVVHPNLASPGGNLPPASGPPTPPPADEGVQLTKAEEAIRAKFAPYIQSMRKDNTEYTPEQYARSKGERAGFEGVPILEEKK